MAIVNTTPDSFSDGGLYAEAETAISHASSCVQAGADILDIGGESTRPGAQPVDADEEMARVLPVIEGIRKAHPDVLLSVDTRKAIVAEAAIAAGADIVNDISACTDPDMADVISRARAGVVLMHMQGTPETMQAEPAYGDVVGEVETFLLARTQLLLDAGLPREHICWDPGIGFGKTLEHNVTLIAATGTFGASYPVLMGLSRKRWIGEITGAEVNDRLAGSLAGAAAALSRGAHILRVHDVKETCEMALVMDRVQRSEND